MDAPLAPRRSPLDAWCAGKVGVAEASFDRAALEQSQLDRLRQTLEWARVRSPFYRQRLPSLAPRSLEALRALPFTTPAELREHGARMVCVSQDAIDRVVTLQSSGTTGAPKRVFFTRDEQASIVDFFMAGMSTFVEKGERVLVFLPGPLPGSVGALLGAALERMGVTALVHGFVREVRAAAELLTDPRPTSLVALPVQALALAHWVTAHAPGSVRLKGALLTADHVPPSLARQVSEGLGAVVFEHYGMTEMGLGGGVECEAHAGYHLREADLLFEVVDPRDSAPVADGELGEVVFTTLDRRAMPLIRYRTGDLARSLPGQCPCGSVIRRLSRVRGRVGAPMIGHLTLPLLDDLLFACPEVVDFTADASQGRLKLTAFSLGPLSPPAMQALEREVRGALPHALVAFASLDGRLTSGPAKRAFTGPPEHGDGR